MTRDAETTWHYSSLTRPPRSSPGHGVTASLVQPPPGTNPTLGMVAHRGRPGWNRRHRHGSHDALTNVAPPRRPTRRAWKVKSRRSKVKSRRSKVEGQRSKDRTTALDSRLLRPLDFWQRANSATVAFFVSLKNCSTRPRKRPRKGLRGTLSAMYTGSCQFGSSLRRAKRAAGTLLGDQYHVDRPRTSGSAM